MLYTTKQQNFISINISRTGNLEGEDDWTLKKCFPKRKTYPIIDQFFRLFIVASIINFCLFL